MHRTTAAKAYRLVSSMMKAAVADEVIARNPCQIAGATTERARHEGMARNCAALGDEFSQFPTPRPSTRECVPAILTTGRKTAGIP